MKRDFHDEKGFVERPGLKVWDQWSYETDYYVLDPVRPVIVMHLGRPPSCRMWDEVQLPPSESARSEIPARVEQIIEGLGSYGAKKLPFEHPRIRKYLLPGGTRMIFSNFSGCVTVQGRKTYMQIQFEPAQPRNVPTPLPAFPGAEGYGAYSRGGRVGRDFEDEVNVGELNLRRARELRSQRDAFRRDHSPEQAVDRIRKLLRIRNPLPKAETRRIATLAHAGCRVEKLILRRADDVPLPALLVTPLDTKCPKLPVTLIVDAAGKSATIKRALRLATSGRVVLTVDLRGYGETRDTGSNAKYFNHEQYTGYLAMHVGRPLLGQRVEDLLAAVDALASDARVDGENIELLAVRSAGPVAMHAAVLDRRISSLRMEQSIRSWIDDVVARPLERDLMGHVVPGALCWYDLPDLVGLLKNR